MTQKIDTFYLIDFDRCLGNIEGSFDILKEVVHDLGIVDRQIFKSMREEIELRGQTFSALERIKSHFPSVVLDDVEKLYQERAKLEPYNLLEPGAIELINYLNSTNRMFCIMSFGDNRWQTIKILSSGIGKVPMVIVPKSQKSKYIRKWRNHITKKFVVPKGFFADNLSKEAREVVLIDDKASAFNNLPKGARGYCVTGSSSIHLKASKTKLPTSVMQVSRIDEIITLESARSPD